MSGGPRPGGPSSEVTADISPLGRHGQLAPDAVASGRPDHIKALYTRLGDDWWAASEAGLLPDGAPVLSAPETAPIVVGCVESAATLILDAGCGPNPAVSIFLARRQGRTIISSDIGWGTVRLAVEEAQRVGVHLLGVAADLEALPFRPGSFDAVVCDDTIEHVPDDRRAIAELAAVTRRGGTIVIATPNRHNAVILRRRIADRLHRAAKPASAYFVAASHLREYTWGELEALARRHLVVEGRRAVGWSGSGKRQIANRLLGLPMAHRLGQMIVVRCSPA